MNKAISLAPDLPDGYFYRRVVRLKNREYESAVKDLSKTIDMDFYDVAVALQKRAEAYRAVRKLDLAAVDEKKAAESDRPQ